MYKQLCCVFKVLYNDNYIGFTVNSLKYNHFNYSLQDNIVSNEIINPYAFFFHFRNFSCLHLIPSKENKEQQQRNSCELSRNLTKMSPIINNFFCQNVKHILNLT